MAEDKKRPLTARRASAPERQTKRFVMVMSEDDHARVKAVADKRGVSMARLFKESALSDSYDRRERLAVIAALGVRIRGRWRSSRSALGADNQSLGSNDRGLRSD